MFNFDRKKQQQTQDTKLYDLLDVDPKATQEEIKKAWKKKSAKVHPDRHPPEKREEMTKLQQEVNQAYEILKEPKTRSLYDQVGLDGLSEMGNGAEPEGFSAGFPFGGGFPFDGGFPFGGERRQRNSQPQVRDQKVKIQVRLEDIYRGGEKTIKIQQKINCTKCDGKGVTDASAIKECGTCQGYGQIPKIQQVGPGMMVQTSVPCHTCRGRGKEIDKSKECAHCQGNQVIDNIKEITYNLPKGIHQGEAITIYGEANQVPGTSRQGDLHLIVEEIPSQTGLIRKGDHLLYVMEVDLADALCGFKKVIKHLDGRNLLIEHQKIVKPGDLYQLRGEGMPISQNGRFMGSYGDLIIQFEIKFPERLGKDSKSIEERKNFIRMILPKSKNLKEDEIENGGKYEEKYLEDFEPHERHSPQGFEEGFVINEGGPGDCVQQ